jgi:hypothetical protein
MGEECRKIGHLVPMRKWANTIIQRTWKEKSSCKRVRNRKTHGFESMKYLWPTKRIHPKNGNPFFPTPKNEPKFVYEQEEEFKPAQHRKIKGRKRQK